MDYWSILIIQNRSFFLICPNEVKVCVKQLKSCYFIKFLDERKWLTSDLSVVKGIISEN